MKKLRETSDNFFFRYTMQRGEPVKLNGSSKIRAIGGKNMQTTAKGQFQTFL